MRTVRYPIIESDLAENGIVGSMRLAEELVKSPYGSPELWDVLSDAIKFAEEQIKKIDSDIFQEVDSNVTLRGIGELKAKKIVYITMLNNLKLGVSAAIKAVQNVVLDSRIDADPNVGVGLESRKRLLNELKPKDAEDLLKKLSDLTLLNPYEVELYLLRQK